MDVIDQRLVKGAPGVIRWSRLDADGDIAAAAGTVTIGIVDANGAEVIAAGTATTTDSGVHSLSLTAAQVTALGLWTATFTDDGDGLTADVIADVATERLIRISQLRHLQRTLKDVNKYPADMLRDEILAAEIEVEYICGRAFTPRYAREVLDGSGTAYLGLGHRDIRSVTSVTIGTTALTATELAALKIGDTDLYRSAGWPDGIQNITVEYIHGWTNPPPDLVRAMALRIRLEVHSDNSRIPERAERFSDDTGSFDLARPGALSTGYPRVDGIYSRYSARIAKTLDADGGGNDGSGIAAASVPIDIDPTSHSLFHQRR